MSKDIFVEIEIQELGRATERAQLVTTKDGREVWIPFSQIAVIHRSEPPSLEIAEWFAKKEDLI